MATGYNLPCKLSLVGNISENFKKFKQSFNIYLEAAGLSSIAEARKIAILLNLIGEDALSVYNTLQKEDVKTLREVLEVFEAYCNPKKNVLHCRYLFYNRSQKHGEQFDSYLTELTRLCNDCDFQNKNEILRDRLLLGSSDVETQNKLIKLGDPPLEDVITSLGISEITNSQVKEIQKTEVDAVTFPKNYTSQQVTGKKTCLNCGYNHQYGQCPAHNKTCVKCKRRNHFAKMCRSTKVTNEVNVVQDDSDYYVETVTSNISKSVDSLAWLQTVALPGDNCVQFKLDPGADVNILPVYIFEKVTTSIPIPLKNTTATLESWNGFKTPIKGLATMDIEVNGKRYTETFCVAGSEKSVPLLCRDTCVRLNLVKRMSSLETKLYEKQDLINKNEDLFVGIGKFSEPYDIKLKDDATPTSKPPYRVPLKLRPKLQEELNRLEGLGIISKVTDPSEWVNRLVILGPYI